MKVDEQVRLWVAIRSVHARNPPLNSLLPPFHQLLRREASAPLLPRNCVFLHRWQLRDVVEQVLVLVLGDLRLLGRGVVEEGTVAHLKVIYSMNDCV